MPLLLLTLDFTTTITNLFFIKRNISSAHFEESREVCSVDCMNLLSNEPSHFRELNSLLTQKSRVVVCYITPWQLILMRVFLPFCTNCYKTTTWIASIQTCSMCVLVKTFRSAHTDFATSCSLCVNTYLNFVHGSTPQWSATVGLQRQRAKLDDTLHRVTASRLGGQEWPGMTVPKVVT